MRNVTFLSVMFVVATALAACSRGDDGVEPQAREDARPEAAAARELTSRTSSAPGAESGVAPGTTPMPDDGPAAEGGGAESDYAASSRPPDASQPHRADGIGWNGGTWYLHGANIPWYNWACDFGCNQNGGVSSRPPELEAGLGQLADAGVGVARWWVFPGDPWQIERDDLGTPTGINPAVYADFDAALQLGEQYDLHYVFTLFSSPTSLPRAWLLDPAARSRLASVLGNLFARYNGNPRVLAWDIFNEPEWDIWNGKIGQAPVQQGVRAIAASVHASSSAYVTVGSAMLDGLPLWMGLGLDFYDAHWYDYMSEGDWCARCTDYQSVKRRHALDKPLVIGEFYSGPDTDASLRFDDWYAKGFAGAYAWSLFGGRTKDGMSVDLAAAREFALSHADIGP